MEETYFFLNRGTIHTDAIVSLLNAMLNIVQLTLFMAFIRTGFAILRNDCRQCTGSVSLTLTSGVDIEPNISDIVSDNVAMCLDTKESHMSISDQLDCGSGGRCKTFKFSLTSDRFCGTGPSAKYSRSLHCDSALYKGPCTLLFDLSCTKSVECFEVNCGRCPK